MKPPPMPLRVPAVCCALLAVHWWLAHELSHRDPLLEVTRGHGFTTVSLLVALLTTRVVLIFIAPGWLSYRFFRWIVAVRESSSRAARAEDPASGPHREFPL